ncbi:MAG: LacI family DNA-binding transcriptional regulator [Pseudomonadota bacterium]
MTITDLAEHLGMTKGTVSRALNDYADISETTKTRVRREADRMGYRPHAQAQAVRTGRAKSIGLVLQIDEHDGQSPFLKDFIAGLTGATSEIGWTLTVGSATSDDDMIQTMARMVDERKVDGFVLPRARVNDHRLNYLTSQGVPAILYGRSNFFAEDTAAYFDISGEDAMEDAVMRLHALGHNRIGYVGGVDVFNFTHLRHEGYREGLDKAGLDYDAGLVRWGARTAQDGADAFRSLIESSKPPTAVVFSTDETALGAYHVARDLGLRIGDDVSVVAYDGIPEADHSDPSLATYRVDNRSAGHKLIEMLKAIIDGAPAPSQRLLETAKFHAGGSISAPRRTSEELRAYIL